MSTATAGSAPAAVKHKYKKKSQAKIVWNRYRRSKLAMIGLVVFILMLLTVLTADLFFDYDTDVVGQDLTNRFQAPSAEHPFGTDSLGRDQLARVIYGGRISMFVGIATVAVLVCILSLLSTKCPAQKNCAGQQVIKSEQYSFVCVLRADRLP